MSALDWLWMGTDYELFCDRCTDSYKPALPIQLSLLEALIEQFIKDHRVCEIKPAETPGGK